MSFSGQFKGVSEAQFFTRYPFILPGNYLLQLEKVKLIDTRNKGKAFLIEALVLESTNPERAPGTHVTQMFMASKDSFLGNVKAFVYAALKGPRAANLKEPSQVTEAHCEEIVSEDNPACGHLLRVEATMAETKDRRPFTRVNWIEADEADWVKHVDQSAA